MLSLLIKYKIGLINTVYLPFMWTSEEKEEKKLNSKGGGKNSHKTIEKRLISFLIFCSYRLALISLYVEVLTLSSREAPSLSVIFMKCSK